MLNGARWLLYWGLYSLILTSATWILSQSKVKRINQVNETPTRPIRVALLSLRGVPPLLGFGLKIMALSSVLTVRPVLGLILLLGLTVALYFYLRMFLFSWLKISSPSTKTRASKGHFIRGSVNLRGLLLLCQYGRIWCNSFRCYLWIILLTTRVINKHLMILQRTRTDWPIQLVLFRWYSHGSEYLKRKLLFESLCL